MKDSKDWDAESVRGLILVIVSGLIFTLIAMTFIALLLISSSDFRNRTPPFPEKVITFGAIRGHNGNLSIEDMQIDCGADDVPTIPDCMARAVYNAIMEAPQGSPLFPKYHRFTDDNCLTTKGPLKNCSKVVGSGIHP